MARGEMGRRLKLRGGGGEAVMGWRWIDRGVCVWIERRGVREEGGVSMGGEASSYCL